MPDKVQDTTKRDEEAQKHRAARADASESAVLLGQADIGAARHALASLGTASPAQILALSHTAGNRVVSRLLNGSSGPAAPVGEREFHSCSIGATPRACPFGGACHVCPNHVSA
jgi:hypothetical protein